MTLIAIDAGHGPQTPGKRTPFFPDGTFMHENEFNHAVADMLEPQLLRCGFQTLRVFQPTVDTPLKDRTDAANAAGANLCLSIHANADGSEWGSANGIETFHYVLPSAESVRAATIIHRHLIEGTQLRDRGVKAADFHMVREPHMPSLLVECGFMSNLEEAKLLLTEAYRLECATEIAQGICEYFDVDYITEAEEAIMKEQMELLQAKITELETKLNVLEKTPAPDWFITEFGNDEIEAYLNEASGDVDFWRNFAVMLRVLAKKNL